MVNLIKYKFGLSAADFLGYKIDKNTIKFLPERTESIHSFSVPGIKKKYFNFLAS